jgi:hypothetical protein
LDTTLWFWSCWGALVLSGRYGCQALSGARGALVQYGAMVDREINGCHAVVRAGKKMRRVLSDSRDPINYSDINSQIDSYTWLPLRGLWLSIQKYDYFCH